MITNIILALLKLIIGFISGSRALMADGVHSASDISSDLAVLWSWKASNHPADQDHPYGHRRYQTIVALFISGLLFLAAGGIIYDSLKTLSRGPAGIAGWAPFYVAVFSIAAKEIIFHLTRRVAKCFRDDALMANAWHHRSDAFSSIPVAVGVAVVLIGGEKWYFVDQLMAAALGVIIITVAWKIGRKAFMELTDHAPSERVMKKVREILSEHPEVKDFHGVRARTMGGFVEMDFHILVDPELTVRRGHDIAEEVEILIKNTDESVSSVVVHVEPWKEKKKRGAGNSPE